jgi:hypothetical protein
MVGRCEDHGALDGVFELADVAGPAVRISADIASAEMPRRPSSSARPHATRKGGRAAGCPRAVAQRRDGDDERAEAEVQVLAERAGRRTAALRSRFVAATTRACTRMLRSAPTRRISRSWSARSSFACTVGATSPISSRKIVP